MIVKSTAIKVLVLIILLATAYFLFQQYFTTSRVQYTHSTSKTTPSSNISLAPKDKKSGWTTEEETQILNKCPLPSFASAICTCALTKVEERYTFKDAMAMYNEYQNNKTIDPKLQEIIGECR